jgi:predicted nucleic acid-binding protein
MKIFLDVNILVSVLNKEYPVFTYSSRILSLADNAAFHVYTSPLCLAIAFYFAEKKSGSKAALEKMRLLTGKIKIADTTGSAVAETIRNVKVNDFEDGLEYYSALHAGCSCIITEDTRDFYFSSIEVLRAHDFFVKYLAKQD